MEVFYHLGITFTKFLQEKVSKGVSHSKRAGFRAEEESVPVVARLKRIGTGLG